MAQQQSDLVQAIINDPNLLVLVTALAGVAFGIVGAIRFFPDRQEKSKAHYTYDDVQALLKVINQLQTDLKEKGSEAKSNGKT